MIVVTTPTGNIGSKVVQNLLAANQAVRVIARDPSKLEANVRDKVEIVQGSHGDSDVVRKAFRGADAVLWIVPPNPQAPDLHAAYVDFSRPAAEAFIEQGVQHVVAVSSLGRGTPWSDHAGLVTASLAMDDLLASTGVSFRALALPSFMDNMLQQAETIKTQGMFFGPLDGDRQAPTCATRDIAAAATKLLSDRSWTGQGEVAVLGPEDLSFDRMAAILTEVLDKPVRYQQIPMDAFRARLAGMGMSEAFVQGFVAMMEAKNQGSDNAVPRTPETSSPTSFRQWAEAELKPVIQG